MKNRREVTFGPSMYVSDVEDHRLEGIDGEYVSLSDIAKGMEFVRDWAALVLREGAVNACDQDGIRAIRERGAKLYRGRITIEWEEVENPGPLLAEARKSDIEQRLAQWESASQEERERMASWAETATITEAYEALLRQRLEEFRADAR